MGRRSLWPRATCRGATCRHGYFGRSTPAPADRGRRFGCDWSSCGSTLLRGPALFPRRSCFWDWRSQHKAERPAQRLIVFGSGNLFAGAKLEPAQEKLLLHSANWLTGREDRLPRADQPAWAFPRVAMTNREMTLWRLGTAVGLPLVAVYLGLMVTMLRRLR